MVFDGIDQGVGVMFVTSDVVVYSRVGCELCVPHGKVVFEGVCHEYVGLQGVVG